MRVAFGWDNNRKMVTAPAQVWVTFAARINSSALNWQDKAFPYKDELTLYFMRVSIT